MEYRAPLGLMVPYGATVTVPQVEIQEDVRPRTRCGYLVPEAYSCYETALAETGSVASGKALHFAADLICSGGIDIWIRGAYSYAIQHISLANPRIFVYLKKRVQELDTSFARLPQEAFYANPDVQASVAEVVLVLQLCPKKSRITWPKIDPSTKRPGWLRGVAGSQETRATRVVWGEGDTTPLYLVSNELCKAISNGSSETALFWVRWVLEEDARIRKETKGAGLSTRERGTGTTPKERSDAGHFIAAVVGEIYKELSEKALVRMHEEFAELMRLWRGGEKRMAAAHRKTCLALMVLIVSEVPRWKVPAAPTLVEDPMRLSRAVGQAPTFFTEVLRNAPVAEVKPKMTRVPKKPRVKAPTEKDKKTLSLEEHFDAYDAAMEAYLSR